MTERLPIVTHQPPSYFAPPGYGAASNTGNFSSGCVTRMPVLIATMDEEAIADFMFSHACVCSLIPPFSCLCLQPFRACCCAKNEGRRQTKATRLILYDNELELHLNDYCLCCTCPGAGPAPRPEIGGLCWGSGDMMKIMALDQISQITVFRHWGMNSVRIVSSTPFIKAGRDSTVVTVNGILNAEEFVRAVTNQMKIAKTRPSTQQIG